MANREFICFIIYVITYIYVLYRVLLIIQYSRCDDFLEPYRGNGPKCWHLHVINVCRLHVTVKCCKDILRLLDAFAIFANLGSLCQIAKWAESGTRGHIWGLFDIMGSIWLCDFKVIWGWLCDFKVIWGHTAHLFQHDLRFEIFLR